jgi:Mrp family chromosome partitioning ATPase
MEKIQAALEKARSARNAGTARAVLVAQPNIVAAPVADRAEVKADPALAWAALTPCQPDVARLVKHRITAVTGGAQATPFDMMRTKVIQQMRANGWRRLAITSPTPDCGKSTIALNLAFSLARQTELRTILAEIDLRRPSLGATLGLRGTSGDRPGFARVLEGKAEFADCALRYADGLALAVNDGPVRNSAELLHGSAVAPALAAIEARYAPDLMLFDMPPMLVSDDVMAFLAQVDAVLLVAGAETTTIKEIDTCERDLAAQTNVMGVVLNKCNYLGRESAYNYYG